MFRIRHGEHTNGLSFLFIFPAKPNIVSCSESSRNNLDNEEGAHFVDLHMENEMCALQFKTNGPGKPVHVQWKRKFSMFFFQL
jgi:hypothetical protein